MKQIYHFTGTAGKQQSLKAGVVLLLMGVMLTLLPTALQAQPIKNFTQRTSNYSPNMPIYHIKGDYTMIGNTNLSNTTNLNGPNNYTGNNSTEMYYVDVDRDTFPTINSSTAALTFSEEFGANPACSEVLYAGLYWTGITDDQGMDWPMTHDVRNRGTIAGYNLTITGGQNNPTFTFSKPGSDPIVLTLTVSGNASNRRFNLTYNGNTVYSGVAPYEQESLLSYWYYMEPNQTITLAENITINRIYWHNNDNDPYVRIAEGTISKNKIKIRHDNAQ